MSHTFYNLTHHVVFATKGRERWLDDGIRPWLFAQIAAIINEKGGLHVISGGVEDHVHVLAKFRPTHRPCDLIGAVKATTSGRIHRHHPHLAHFDWQEGYGLFTVGHREIEQVRAYIAGQEEHHRSRTINEELLALYEENGIAVEEKTMWD